MPGARCGAKRKSGGFCRSWPLAGKRRCKRHNGPRNPGGWHPGLLPGSLAWRKRILEARAAGLLPAKVPQLGGWPKGMPRKPKDRIPAAVAVIEQAEAALAAGTDTGLARELEEVVGLGLGRIKQALLYGGKRPKADVLFKQADLGTAVLRTVARINNDLLLRKNDDRFLAVLEGWERAKDAAALPALENETPTYTGFQEDL